MTDGPMRHRAAPSSAAASGHLRRSRSRTPSSTTTATSTWPTATGSTPRRAVARAAAVGVPRIVQIGCDLPGAQWAVDAAREHDALVAGVALHPNEAPRLAAEGRLDEALAEIERLAQAHDKVRAVGETGLDHFRTAPRAGASRSSRSSVTSIWRSGSTRRS